MTVKAKANPMGNGDVQRRQAMGDESEQVLWNAKLEVRSLTVCGNGGKETGLLELGAPIHMERPLVLQRDSESVGTGLYGICKGAGIDVPLSDIATPRTARTDFASAPWGKLLRRCEGKCELNE